VQMQINGSGVGGWSRNLGDEVGSPRHLDPKTRAAFNCTFNFELRSSKDRKHSLLCRSLPSYYSASI
jgi:hypothetical protein